MMRFMISGFLSRDGFIEIFHEIEKKTRDFESRDEKKSRETHSFEPKFKILFRDQIAISRLPIRDLSRDRKRISRYRISRRKKISRV